MWWCYLWRGSLRSKYWGRREPHPPPREEKRKKKGKKRQTSEEPVRILQGLPESAVHRHPIWPDPVGVDHGGVNAEAALRVGAVDLHHGELDPGGRVGALHHKVADLVVDPAPRLLQEALPLDPLPRRGGQLELHRLDVPSVDVLRVADPAPEPLAGPPQVEPEEEAVGARREAELDLPIYLEPPGLLQVRHRVESAPPHSHKIHQKSCKFSMESKNPSGQLVPFQKKNAWREHDHGGTHEEN